RAVLKDVKVLIFDEPTATTSARRSTPGAGSPAPLQRSAASPSAELAPDTASDVTADDVAADDVAAEDVATDMAVSPWDGHPGHPDFHEDRLPSRQSSFARPA
nr:hypothetical protein [Microthrixaceae bacterium]